MLSTGENENAHVQSSASGPDGFPPYFQRMFDHDPLRAAQETLGRQMRDIARAGTGSECEALARQTYIAELAGLAAPNEKMRDAACNDYASALRTLAQTPATSEGDVRLKLAALVRELSEKGGISHEEGSPFALAASALADLTILQAGPLRLPPGAALPIASAADVERWRAVADRFDREE